MEVRVPAPFRAPLWSGTWRLRFGPRLMAVCAHLRISLQLLEHAETRELRAIVQVRIPLALLQAGWRPDLVLQMPRERDQPALAELPVSLRKPDIRLRPSLLMMIPRAALSTTFPRLGSQPRASLAPCQPQSPCLLLSTAP